MSEQLNLSEQSPNRCVSFVHPVTGQLGSRGITRPRVDIRETDKAYFLYAEMPGVDENTAEVVLEKHVLKIAGTTTPFEPEGYQQVYRESGPRYYERLIRLPEEIEASQLEATVKNGVLQVCLPKMEAAQAVRIKINRG